MQRVRQFSEIKEQVSENDFGIRLKVDLRLARPPPSHYMLAEILLLSRTFYRNGAVFWRRAGAALGAEIDPKMLPRNSAFWDERKKNDC